MHKNAAWQGNDETLLLQLQPLVCFAFSGSRPHLVSCCVLRFSLTQFIEIKGSVFKKFGKNNLFQMSNSGKKVFLYINYTRFIYLTWK